MPNRITASIPAAWSSDASASSSPIEKRSIPGIDSTGSRTPSPETTKRGWTRCRGESSVSRTRSRRAFVRRTRRIRVAGKLTARILGLEPLRGGHRRAEEGRGLVLGVLVADEGEVDHARVERGVHALDLPPAIDRAQAPDLAVGVDRSDHRAVDRPVVIARATALGGGGEHDELVGERRGVAEGEPDPVQLAELVGGDPLELVGIEVLVAGERVEDPLECKLRDGVLALVCVSAVKEREAPTQHRRALDVELLDLPPQGVIQRSQVDRPRLALERSLRPQLPEEAAVATSFRPGAEAEQAAVRGAIERRHRG